MYFYMTAGKRAEGDFLGSGLGCGSVSLISEDGLFIPSFDENEPVGDDVSGAIFESADNEVAFLGCPNRFSGILYESLARIRISLEDYRGYPEDE